MAKPMAFLALFLTAIAGGSLNAHHSYGDFLVEHMISRLKEIRRPADNWRWSSTQPGTGN